MKEKIGIYRIKKKKPWLVRWFGEYDLTTGKQRRYGKAFATRRQAELFRAEKEVELKNGGQRDKPGEMSLRTFCSEYLKAKKRDYRPGTLELYGYTVDRLITYFGGDTFLSNITPRQAARFIAEIEPLKFKKELSDWTSARTLRNCKTMFSTAVDWELIPKNPFASIKAPKCVVKRWHYVTPAEFLGLLEVCPTP